MFTPCNDSSFLTHSKCFQKPIILFCKKSYGNNQPANHPVSLSEENPRYTQNRWWWCLIELHSEMMQMLLTMSHRIPTTYKGAGRGSWDSAEFEAALLTHYTALLLLEQRCDCGCALVYYWALSRGRARMLSVQTQWLKSYWTHMISIELKTFGSMQNTVTWRTDRLDGAMSAH